MNPQTFGQVFPLGSHLCREPMPPMAELKQDMENLKRHGFNLIKLQEHWAVDEPVEGHCCFSRYEELIEHAAHLDMGVYLGLTCEQAPAWLWRKHPDCRMVGRNGLPIAYEAAMTLPADGKPGPCYDHPGAMADQLRFITTLVETLGSYENLVVWNTWQEIGYWAESLVGQSVCFCPHTLAHFRAWLSERYGDLDALNLLWNTRYGEWLDVSPGRGVGTQGPYAVDLAWQYFSAHIQIGGVLRARAQAIRQADRLKRPVFAHKGGPAIGSGEDWTYARCQDFLGSSCYPAWGFGMSWDDARVVAGTPPDRHRALLTEMWDGVALKYDYIWSCNPPGNPIWAAEFQGGPVSTGFQKGRVPSADDIRRWMFTAVGSGVTAISFWVTRAEIMASEMNGFSLLDSHGDTSERFQEVARVGQALGRYPDLFGKTSRPRSQIALLVDDWNYRCCTALTQGGEHLSYSMRGWHRLLWDAGIPADFVSTSELDEGYVRDYRALLLPFPLSLSEKVAAKLVGYVEQGGQLISEAAPGRIDEHGFCNRGELSPAMRDLFGVRHDTFTMVREPDCGTRWSPPERTYGEYLDAAMLTGDGPLAGHRVRANGYIETFQCQDSQPCLRFGDAVAGTVRHVGRGSAWLLGTFAGHNGTAYSDGETQACLRSLLDQCGVFPEHTGALLLRKRVRGDQAAWIFTNPTPDDVTESINVDGWKEAQDIFGERLPQNGNTVSVKVKSLDVRILVLTGKLRS
ncbi:MAG: beta-galactosidase [Candidatus Latescibacterota bacterium]